MCMPNTGVVESVFDECQNTCTSYGRWPLTVCLAQVRLSQFLMNTKIPAPVVGGSV